MFSIHYLLPDDPFATQICQTLNDAGSQLDSIFWLQNVLLYCKSCIYVLERQPRCQVLKLCHESPLMGHFGQLNSWNLVSRSLCLGLWAYIKDYIRSCNLCSQTKNPQSKPLGLLQHLPISLQPWSIVSVDFAVELPCSQGHSVILIIIDLTNTEHFILFLHMWDGSVLPGKCILLPLVTRWALCWTGVHNSSPDSGGNFSNSLVLSPSPSLPTTHRLIGKQRGSNLGAISLLLFESSTLGNLACTGKAISWTSDHGNQERTSTPWPYCKSSVGSILRNQAPGP